MATEIEGLTDRNHLCGCGGTLGFKNDVMLCDACGYGAHMTISFEDNRSIFDELLSMGVEQSPKGE